MADDRPITAAVGESAGAEPLAALEIWQWLTALAAQLAALHESGSLHGAVSLENITLDGAGQPGLAPPAASLECDSGGGVQRWPPELQGKTIGPLPTNLAAAHKRLVQAGVAIDPRRIDTYRFRALVCRLTGQSGVDAYLRSAKARAKVASRLRPIVDRCLGFDPNARFADCRQVIAAVREAEEASHVAEAETPALGNAELSAQGNVDAPSLHTPPTGHRPATGHRDDATPCTPPFARLGGYRILERIGGGGMGDVFKAVDEGLERVVAIKVLPAELARHPDFVRRFRAEATAIARLVHPNVVQVFACGEDAGHHYFAMQFVLGESLAGLLARHSKLGVDETLPIILQCLAGLAAAHAQGLIHRDIKPGNILLDQEHGRALVADFGLVKTSGGGENLTATGVIVGTVDYIPPEQARGLKVDSRSDLYSVGALMYRMLSGRLPFESDSPTGMIFQHAFEQPTPLRDVAPEVPEALAGIVMRLLEKYPNNRYQSAVELTAAIEAFRAGKPVALPARRQPVEFSRPAPLPQSQQDTGEWLPVAGRRGWRTQLWSLFHAHAPALVKELLNTQHQLDGAVFEYQRRRARLAQLAEQAQGLVADFETQIRQHRLAAAEAARQASATDAERAAAAQRQQAELERVADDLASQLAGQQEQLHDLRLQLAQVDATLSKLRSQRDILEARLKTARAEIAADAVAKPARRSVRRGTLAATLIALFGMLLIYLLKSSASSGPPRAWGLAVVLAILTLVVLIRLLRRSASPPGAPAHQAKALVATLVVLLATIGIYLARSPIAAVPPPTEVQPYGADEALALWVIQAGGKASIEIGGAQRRTSPTEREVGEWRNLGVQTSGAEVLEVTSERAVDKLFRKVASESLSARLTGIDLQGTSLADHELGPLAAATMVRHLDLQNTATHDPALVYVARMPELEFLDLGATQITHLGLAQLVGLKKLSTLGLRRTHATDTGLEFVGRLTALRSLNLDHTPITDAGLAHLAGLAQLDFLNLDSTEVTDAGMPSLVKLKGLRSLILAKTGVTDAGLRQLAHLELKDLNVKQTAVTAAGVALLETTGCKVAWSGPPVWPAVDTSGWSALAGLVDPTRDKLDASWTLDGDAVEFAAHKPRAYVSIPVQYDASYELAARITIVRAKETTALYLPVGRKNAAVLDIRGDNGNTESPTATTSLLGLRPAPRAQAAATIRVGTEYDYLIKVVTGDGPVEIVVHRDGQLLYEWSGPLDEVSHKNVRPGTICFETAYYTVSRIRDLRFRLLSGQAMPVIKGLLQPSR